MKRVLVVGAGIGQVFLAQKIKERGCYLIVVSIAGNYPVFAMADKCYYDDVFDKERVLEIAKAENVDAVVSDQNDLMMPTVAYVSEHLGLPGNNTSIVNVYCNKYEYREVCDKLNVPSPKHVLVKDTIVPIEFKNVPFPWMVKPCDSQSSKGVCKVSNVSEYEMAVKEALSFSQTKAAIVEEFFEGKELVAEGFIYNGEYYNLGFADRRYFDLPHLFIPSQTIFPSVVPNEIKQKIVDCESKIARHTSPSFAIVHSEYLYNEAEKEIRVVESALRGGGVYISSHLVPLYSGIDVNELLLDCALGEKVNEESLVPKRSERAAAYICFYLPQGTVEHVAGVDEIEQLPFVHLNEVHNIEVGQKTQQMKFKGQRLGPIVIDANNRDEIEQRIKEIQSILHVKVISEAGDYNDIIWS